MERARDAGPELVTEFRLARAAMKARRAVAVIYYSRNVSTREPSVIR